LKIRTVEQFPLDYAETQNNLGEAYRNLADVTDKEDNLKLAIFAFEQAEKINAINECSSLRNSVILNIENVKKLMK